jgi:hypothetical protein
MAAFIVLVTPARSGGAARALPPAIATAAGLLALQTLFLP